MDSRHDLAIGSAFSSRVNTGVPVEIVEAENQGVESVLSTESDRQNVSSAEESMPMDISVGSGPTMDSSQLASSMAVDAAAAGLPGMENPQISSGISSVDASQLVGEPQLMPSSHLARNSIGVDTSQIPVPNPRGMRVPDIQNVERQLQQAVSQTTSIRGSFQQIKVNQAVLSSQTLEISPESITFPSSHPPSLSESLGSAMVHQLSAEGVEGSHDPLERAKQILGSVSYTDLDIGRAINSSIDPNLAVSSSISANSGGIDTTTVLNDPESPSSPESNFDSSDLLNTSVLQQDEVTARLANAGPIGVAAAAAVMSGRKRKRSHSFESNPALRKRHCSKLVRKLKDTIEELATRVGLQACVVTYRPGKQEPKEEPSFKVFGATPLNSSLRNQKDSIITEMEAVLHDQTPLTRLTTQDRSVAGPLHDLPPLLFEGIPTPVHKMTQAQLRAFIPNMLKFSTGRGKPGWGKEDMKPVWWPVEAPWQNVRSDTRTDDQKKMLSWTEALRRIVICCYVYHGRIDLLPEFSAEHLQHALSPEAAEQLQLHLDRLQQQGEFQQPSSSSGDGGGTAIPHHPEEGLGDIATPSQTGDMMEGENQQVFTVDTGLGNCDTSGMPTLVDASLAETAARLQQVSSIYNVDNPHYNVLDGHFVPIVLNTLSCEVVCSSTQVADETGKVQYATQTVTVTDRDAKALGQPVGSTTTVLLTAYPGGHSSGVGPSDSGQQFLSQASTTSTAAATTPTAPNVQVVYSAAHIDSIPDSIVSSISTTEAQSQVYTMDAANPPGTTISMANPSINDSSEAYLSLAGQQLMASASSSGAGGGVEAEQSDLAAELISQYTRGSASDFQTGMEAGSSGAATSTTSTSPPPDVSTSMTRPA